MGFYLGGHISFNRSFTYFSWSIMLSLWGRMNGFSPVLFKTYHILIPIAPIIVIITYEGLGWLEIIFCIVQVFFNSFEITWTIQFNKKIQIACAFLFVGGLIVFGAISGLICVAFYPILICISSLCGLFSGDYIVTGDINTRSDECDGVKRKTLINQINCRVNYDELCVFSYTFT